MPRPKKRPKFNHQANTNEYLHCLGSMLKWSEILLNQKNEKAYNDFLNWIITKQYFKDNNEISIKKIAELSGYNSAKISRWLREIYEDILELNQKSPGLFYQEKGFNIELHFKHYDDYCIINLSIPIIPRVYERLEFYFIKAALGTNYFWVKEITHYIEENEAQVVVSLNGGLVNKYREFALEKALFYGNVNFMDVHKKFDFQIDDELRQLKF
ncbi:hypothetical protein [Epilithonimonas caeni]|uniref:hypothetical protein n=1 Tax=Epilithonimonas caeni TaxID=365343 RepID=UPI00041F6268|nr:hypothetical protein [Epilithonimonas caeni]